ncbi:MAG: response regulator [Verrucomicrobia bacterium]|nr:response regulator [Verrucomicrobiota bacterium]
MSASSGHTPSRPVVLIVDDEAQLREVLQLGLGAEFEVETARSADEAELMMATREFDVVVCDHLMPGEEGLVFLSRAKKQFPRTQRILLTGYMNPELLSRSIAVAGLAACLMKPVSTPDLILAIRQALPL